MNLCLTDIKHYIIDGSWLAHREYAKGNSNGFIELLDMLGQYGRCYVVWDNDIHNFRKDIWPQYKSNRQEKEEGYLLSVINIKRKLIDKNVWQFEPCTGEGDDAIYTLANQFNRSSLIGVVSSDKDFYQLVSNNICLIKFSFKGEIEIFHESNLKEKTGFNAKEHLAMLILAGDSSDCYPGIYGIGIKKASDIINAYPDIIEDVLDGDGDSVLECIKQDYPKLLGYVETIVAKKTHLDIMSRVARLYLVKLKTIKEIK